MTLRSAHLLISVVVALLFAPAAHSADTIFIGPGGGDWNTAANWSGGVVPGPADTAIVNATAVEVHASPAVSPGAVELRFSRLSIAPGARLGILLRLTVQGATLSGPGAIELSPAANLAISTLTVDDGLDLTVGGTTTWSAGAIELQEHAAITSIVVPAPAIFPLLDGSVIGSNTSSDLARIVNAGTIVKSGAGTTTVEAPILNSGAVDVQAGVLGNDLKQSSGQIVVAAGAVIAGSITLDGGALSGRGVISGAVVSNAGTVRPGAVGENGVLSIDGVYTQGAGGTFAVDIAGNKLGSGGPTGYDRLKVTGEASLAGTLALATDPLFAPQTTDVFTILTRASGSGTFGTLTGTVVSAGTYFPTYTPTAVTLGVLPDTTPPLIAVKKDVIAESKAAPVAVLYTSPTATDAHEGAVTVTCEPASGAKFGLGITTVKCRAADTKGNTASSSFDVVVRLPTTPGAVTDPKDLSLPLTTVEPERRVRVNAGGFALRSTVKLLFITATGEQIALRKVKAGKDGRFDVRVEIPEEAPPSASQMTAVGVDPAGSELVRAWLLTVTADD